MSFSSSNWRHFSRPSYLEHIFFLATTGFPGSHEQGLILPPKLVIPSAPFPEPCKSGGFAPCRCFNLDTAKIDRKLWTPTEHSYPWKQENNGCSMVFPKIHMIVLLRQYVCQKNVMLTPCPGTAGPHPKRSCHRPVSPHLLPQTRYIVCIILLASWWCRVCMYLCMCILKCKDGLRGMSYLLNKLSCKYWQSLQHKSERGLESLHPQPLRLYEAHLLDHSMLAAAKGREHHPVASLFLPKGSDLVDPRVLTSNSIRLPKKKQSGHMSEEWHRLWVHVL